VDAPGGHVLVEAPQRQVVEAEIDAARVGAHLASRRPDADARRLE
jgi:hypothetical protein